MPTVQVAAVLAFEADLSHHPDMYESHSRGGLGQRGSGSSYGLRLANGHCAGPCSSLAMAYNYSN